MLLKCVKRIDQVIRIYDAVGRFGGEEFLIVIPGADERQGIQVCERIREAIEGSDMVLDGASIRITASQGGCGMGRNPFPSIN